ncbi:MAG TPA: hypothetical protein ENJ17_04270, partial [Gammaproteobacteria bacterium]|nr:hypothetical protein [Gammaproteobacteria bacterium]
MTKEIHVPDIGDFESVEVIEVLVAPGDSIQAEDSLISVESDKATMEIPAPEAGGVKEVKVAVGDKVSEGSLILLLEPAEAGAEAAPAEATPAASEIAAESPAEPAEPAPAPTPAPAPVRAHVPPTANKIDEVSFSRAHASPAVRKFAR